jgi:hypothetical protein
MNKMSISNDYKSIPFWSWNNELDEKELVKQIELMHQAGCGGFIMHARSGLKTEYLGEKWFSCIDVCLQKARELGMRAWIYDENGWPSGFVGGKLLEKEEYRARFLRYEIKSTYDKTAFCVYKATKKGYERIFAMEEGLKEYYTVYLCVSPSNTDILNPEVVDAFLAETHEKYYERFPDSFGKELEGFFTDEPQYYRHETPYTPILEKEFAKDGENVKDGLIYLFLHDERGYAFRIKYYTMLNKLYTENFYKRIYEWCTEHNCKLTGHSIEEKGLALQMWGGAGVMSSYEYEHMPAIDTLGRDCSYLSARQIGSVSSQLGKKQVLIEAFAICGYDVTPKELKHVGELAFFNGVSKMCQHLYPYSISAQGKYDYPPIFSPQGNWFESFKAFNDYFTKLGYIISNTDECTEVAVIHPMKGTYLDYIRSEHATSVADLEQSFASLIERLRKNGVPFQLVDECILERHGKVEKNALCVGNRRYTAVIVPNMQTISGKTLELLSLYTGKLYLEEKLDYVDGNKTDIALHSNIEWSDIVAFRPYDFILERGDGFVCYRTSELGEFVFLKNSSRLESAEIRLPSISSEYQVLDLETENLYNVSDTFVLLPCESIVLMKNKEAKTMHYTPKIQDITKDFKIQSITDNYLTLDYAQMSLDNGKTWSGKWSVHALFDELLRKDFRGKVRVRYPFIVKEKTEVSLLIEDAKYTFISVNQKSIALEKSGFDVNFSKADITEFLQLGENTVEYELDWFEHDGVHFALFNPMATESLRNCLYYDCSIEPIYLKGNFTLSQANEIEKRYGLPTASNITQQGYPFFVGDMTIDGLLDFDGCGACRLNLVGDFLTAIVYINGVKIPFALDSKKDVTKFLQKGKNDVRIVLKAGLRNLFGPHHSKEKPFYPGSDPNLFTYRTKWNDGKCAEYTDDYQCIPFGLRKVEKIVF